MGTWISVAVVFLAMIGIWLYFQKDRRPELWTFREVRDTECPGGTVYEGHSLHQVDATPWWSVRPRTDWECWRCDGQWRAGPDGP